MDIRVTASALNKLREIGIKNIKIDITGSGWAGPIFGLVQAEPKSTDVIKTVEDVEFAISDEFADIIDYFDVDYRSSFFGKGFSVYPNGLKGSC